LRRTVRAIAALAATAFIAAGCAGARRASAPASPIPSADSIQSEIIHTISKRLTAGLPDSGRLKAARERGVLRVAVVFSPDNALCHFDPDIGAPRGFIPELAAEIALMLEIKPNVELLNQGERPGPEIDIVFLPEGVGGCESNNLIPYYYTPELGWKHICVMDDDGSLKEAVARILSHMNSTGIFAQLHMAHVEN